MLHPHCDWAQFRELSQITETFRAGRRQLADSDAARPDNFGPPPPGARPAGRSAHRAVRLLGLVVHLQTGVRAAHVNVSPDVVLLHPAAEKNRVSGTIVPRVDECALLGFVGRVSKFIKRPRVDELLMTVIRRTEDSDEM